jgi:hypothetical protein
MLSLSAWIRPLGLPVSKKDTVLPFVGSGFSYFLPVYNLYVYIKPLTTSYVKISMSEMAKILE